MATEITQLSRWPRFDYYRLLERLYTGAADPREVTDSQDRFDDHYVESPVWDARG